MPRLTRLEPSRPRASSSLGALFSTALLLQLLGPAFSPGGLASLAAQDSHVKWSLRVEPATATPGAEVELVARYELSEGWHLYSPDHQATGLPTRLAVPALTTRGEVKHPKPVEKEIQLLDLELHRYLTGKGELRQRVLVPADAAPGELKLRALLSYMACSESVCDPPSKDRPFETTLTISAAARPADSPADAPEAGSDLPKLDFPGVDAPGIDAPGFDLGAGLDLGGPAGTVRWRVEAPPEPVVRGQEIELRIPYTVPEGWHIYAPSHRGTGIPVAVRLKAPGLALGPLRSPEPIRHEIPELSETELLLRGEGTLRQAFRVAASVQPGPLEIAVEIDWQACDEKTGVCALPASRKESVTLTVADTPPVVAPRSPEPTDPANPNDEAPGTTSSAAPDDASTGSAGGSFAAPPRPWEQGFWAFALFMIGGGLVTLVMPCTYPMIPLTIAFFTKQAEKRQGSALPLALVFGFGVVLVFVLIGVLFGATIIRFAQGWPLNFIFALAFILFALSFLDLFTLRLPGFLNQLAARASGGNGYVGVFFLGTTIVVTSFTCTAPVVGTLLGAVAGKVTTLQIAGGMAIFGATIALPFVLLALTPGAVKSMPRSGEWMHTVKVTLGFLELAAAIKFLSMADIGYFGIQGFLLSREACLLIWAVILATTGLYLLGIVRLKSEPSEGIGAIRLVVAMLALALALHFVRGVFGYQLDSITIALAPPPREGQSLIDLSAPQRPVGRDEGSEEKQGPVVIWDDWEKAIATAKRLEKRLLINFTGENCVNCRQMEIGVFPKLETERSHYVEARLHIDSKLPGKAEQHEALEREIAGVVTQPVYIIADPEDPRRPLDRVDGLPVPDPVGTFRAFLEANRKPEKSGAG